MKLNQDGTRETNLKTGCMLSYASFSNNLDWAAEMWPFSRL
jgi:hypothetical protein